MAKNTKQNLLNGALILSLAVIAVKLIGVFFKLYVTLKIGYDGKGYYATAYNIYTPIYAIALAGLPTAVAKMVASKAAQGRYRDVKNLFSVSRSLFALTGLAGTVIILLITYPYVYTIDSFDSIPAILAITPSLFFCCVMSGYRGYFQGLQNMKPSAASQSIEAFGKLIFGWLLINILFGTGVAFADKIPVLCDIVTNTSEAYAAAAAISGVTIGSGLALLFLILRYKLGSDGITKEMLENSPESESKKALRRQLFAIAVPIAVSSLVFNVTTLIDNWTIQNRLKEVLETGFETVAAMYPGIVSARGFTAQTANEFKNYLYGAYDTVLEIKNIVPTFTITLGLSAIPVLSRAWTNKDKASMCRSVQSVVRLTLLLALPAGAALVALADDLLYLLYGSSEINAPAIPYIAPILMMYGVSVIFLALAQPVTNMLQAIDRTDVPIKTMGVGAAIKIIANFILVSIPSINIQGAVIGTFLCNIIMVVCGLLVLKKETGLKFNMSVTFIKPAFCAVLSGIAGFAVNGILEKFLPEEGLTGILSFLNVNNISVAAAGVTMVIVYAVSLFAARALSKDDIIMLPKGEKIAKVLEKYRLLG